MNKIFIVGSGTGVGKTVLALLFYQALRPVDPNAGYYKWVQTGVSGPDHPDDDAGFIRRMSEAPDSQTIGAGWRLRQPKAPLFAARDDGLSLDPATLLTGLAEQAGKRSCLVAEAAGGLMVPVTEHRLFIDLLPEVVRMGFRLVMAAPANLGTINHTLLSLEALEKRAIPLSGLFLLDQPGQPVSRDMLTENSQAIEAFGQVRVSGFVPIIKDFKTPPEEVRQVIRGFLGS